MVRYPQIAKYLLPASSERLPVSEWISGNDTGSVGFATNLDQTLSWAEAVKRFPSVLRMLRQPNQFHQTFAQLRFAHWFSENGFSVREFEPRTTSGKPDFRCEIASAFIDVEVVKPNRSNAEQTRIVDPTEQILKEFVQREALADYGLQFSFMLSESLRIMENEEVNRIVDRIEKSVHHSPVKPGESRDVVFDDFILPSPLPDMIPRPLAVTIVHEGESPRMGVGFSPMSHSKPARMWKPTGETLNWMHHLLRSEAKHFDIERLNGIIIDDTFTSEFLLGSFHQLPFGWSATLERFWTEPYSDAVLFVAIARTADNSPSPETSTLTFHPRTAGRAPEAVLVALRDLWSK